MTDLSLARPFLLATDAPARRRRARRFWGTMGVMMRFDDRRNMRTDTRLHANDDMLAVKVAARSWRGG